MASQNSKTSRELDDIKSSCTKSQNLVQNFDTTFSKESSASSVKVKKSSNLLSALVRRARRKKTKPSDELKNLHVSSQNLSCASTVSMSPNPTEEIELSIQNYDKKLDETVEENQSQHSVKSKTDVVNNKISEEIPTKKNTATEKPIIPAKSKDTQCILFEDRLQEEIATKISDSHNIEIISSYVHFGPNYLNITLADGLQTVQDLVSTLRESESQIIELLGKHIKEGTFQKEIVNLVSKHNKLQWEAERRSSALANDMWLHQIETGRAQEQVLHATLNSLVKQNRELQMENESLLRKQEKMMRMKMRVCPEHGLREEESEISHMDTLIRHNEKLQGKLQSAFKQIETLEAELNVLQKQNESFEKQLRISGSKCQDLKACLHRTRTEFDLEQSSLHYKLESQEQLLKESIEAGDVVLEDLDALKRQFKNMPFALNWSKLKVRGSCLTDLIYLCRSCINELSNELIDVTNKSMLREKDMQILKDANEKLQEDLKKSTTEYNNFSKTSENNPFTQDANSLTADEKFQIFENESRLYDEKLANFKREFEIDKKRLEQALAESKMYKNEVDNKEKLIEQTKVFMLNMSTENCTLRNQIEELKNLVKETGAGDVITKFQENIEELESFKVLYSQIKNENQNLFDEKRTLNINIKELETRNMEYKQKNELWKKEVEKMADEVKNLTQTCDKEHHTVTTLQNERMKYLEEKNLLKSVIQHLKNELSRTRELEENLTNVTKEASKLGMMAEYNKHQGEKLKSEITEKNDLIAGLKTSVQKLNEVQIQNAKEKLSLCYELSEAYQLKEKISEVLDIEVKKNQKLDQSKNDVVKTASLHIQKFQEQQNRERTAFQIALKQLKCLEEEKNNFQKEKETYQTEIHKLKETISEQNKKQKATNQTLDIKTKELKNINERLEKSLFVEGVLREKIRKEVLKYDSAKREAQDIITELAKEMKQAGKVCKKLQDEVQKRVDENNHLQNQIKQLQENDIKSLQTKIKTVEKHAAEKDTEIEKVLTEKERMLKDKEHLVQENHKLTKEVEYFNSVMDKVVTDFENAVKSHEEKEQTFQSQLDECQNIIDNLRKNVKTLDKENQVKEEKINELAEKERDLEFYEQKYERMKSEIKDLEEEIVKTKHEKDNLQEKLSNLEEEYKKCFYECRSVAEQKENVENQMKMLTDEKVEDYNFYKKHIADLVRVKNETEEASIKEITVLKKQLEDLSQRLHNEKSAYDTLSEIHKDVSGKFMKSIKELVDLKNAKQDLVRKSQQVNIENEKLSQNFTLLATENETLGSRLEEKIQELQGLQNKHLEVLEKCIFLEKQLQEVNEQDHSQTRNSEKLQDEISSLIKIQEQNFQTIHDLKMKVQDLQQTNTLIELDRSEIAFKLQETEKLLETEKNLSEKLNNTHRLLLAAVLEMKDSGKMDPVDCLHLLHMVHSGTATPGGSTRITSEKFILDGEKNILT